MTHVPAMQIFCALYKYNVHAHVQVYAFWVGILGVCDPVCVLGQLGLKQDICCTARILVHTVCDEFNNKSSPGCSTHSVLTPAHCAPSERLTSKASIAQSSLGRVQCPLHCWSRSAQSQSGAAAQAMQTMQAKTRQAGPRAAACPQQASAVRRSRPNVHVSVTDEDRAWQSFSHVPPAHPMDLQAEIQTLRHQVDELRMLQSHSNCIRVGRKLSKEDYDMLPHRIILIRHAESQGNVDPLSYCEQPDHSVALTQRGRDHARRVGNELRDMLVAAHGPEFKLFIMTSPYRRTLETTDHLLEAFTDEQVIGVRQAVQLREQDFGNFQDPARINQDLTDRQKFGRFWFRFPNGESGADVYDRLTIFEDHLTRDMLMGRFADSSLMCVTHGLTMRIFLMRWFHWAVDDFLLVYNPDNCDPVIVDKLPWEVVSELQGRRYAHAKHCYAISRESLAKLRGCDPSMASYLSRATRRGSKARWIAHREQMAERGLYIASSDDLSPQLSRASSSSSTASGFISLDEHTKVSV